MGQRPNTTRIGILYPGDMGSSLGKLLADDGFRVVTTAEGRSPRTCQLAQQAGLEVLPSLREVVRAAGIVFSVVPPAAAIEVAGRYADLAQLAPEPPIYVDANPVCPDAKRQLGEMLSAARVYFVDGAIHGVAAQLRNLGTLYLSGTRARELADLFAGSLRVRYLGDRPGSAAAFKMMLGGMSKGLIALYLEMSLLAQEAGLGEELADGYRHFYPGVMTAVERILPTYPQHAARRADEMQELEQTMTALGLTPCMVRGTRHLLEGVARAEWADRAGGQVWTVTRVVEELHAQNPLRTPPTPSPSPTEGGGELDSAPPSPLSGRGGPGG